MLLKANGHTVSEYYTISIKEPSLDTWHRVPFVFGHITHAAVAAAWMLHCSHSFIGTSSPLDQDVFPDNDGIPGNFSRHADFKVTSLRNKDLPPDIEASLPSDEDANLVFKMLVEYYTPALIKAMESTKKGFFSKFIDGLTGRNDLGYWSH